MVDKKVVEFVIRLSDDVRISAQALCLQYNLSYEKLLVKLIKEHIIIKMRDEKKEGFEKLKIELTEKNERIFRGIYQFMKRNISFEEFINNWIADDLYMKGFE